MIQAGFRSRVGSQQTYGSEGFVDVGIDQWPNSAKELLETRMAEEPDKDRGGNIKTLLTGRTIEQPHY